MWTIDPARVRGECAGRECGVVMSNAGGLTGARAKEKKRVGRGACDTGWGAMAQAMLPASG